MTRHCQQRLMDALSAGAARSRTVTSWFHDPEHKQEGAEARRLGGLRRRREVRWPAFVRGSAQWQTSAGCLSGCSGHLVLVNSWPGPARSPTGQTALKALSGGLREGYCAEAAVSGGTLFPIPTLNLIWNPEDNDAKELEA